MLTSIVAPAGSPVIMLIGPVNVPEPEALPGDTSVQE
jgi:hypothetical protein